MADRQDYSRQCSADMGGMADEQLEQGYCVRCIQAECVRSSLGKASRFEDRVLNWHERLFEKIPRMPQSDPRFLTIARQGFATIDVGPTPEIRSTSTWHDPRDLVQPAISTPAPAPVEPPVAPPQRFVEQPAASAPTPAAAPPPPATPPAAPIAAPAPAAPTARSRAPLNTPNQSRQMIERPVSAPAALPPVTDPWSAPVKTANPNEVVVPRGAKIKVGG